MPALGSGINAALGRIDYSPIARGGEAAARGIIGAGQAKAQGMMSLGQGIAQGIKGYQKRQKENTILTGQIGSLAQQAGIDGFLDDKSKKLLEEFVDPEKELNNKKLSQLMASLSVASTENQQAQKQEMEAQKLQLEAGQIGAQMRNLAARTRNTDAQTTALGVPKVPQGRLVSMDEFRSMQDQGLSLGGTPMPNGMVLLDEVGTYSSQPGVVVNTGEDAAAKVEATNRVNDRDKVGMEIWNDAKAAYPGIEKLTRGLEIIKSQDPNTGVFQPVTQLASKVLAAFGSKEAMEKASATELLNAMQGSQVFELFSEIGLGARGLDTPAERDFMLDVLSGRVTMTPKSIKSLLNELRDRKIARVKKHNEKAKGNDQYKSFLLERNFGDLPVYDISFLDKEKDEQETTGGTDLGGGFILN
jgi:hypothetical protein